MEFSITENFIIIWAILLDWFINSFLQQQKTLALSGLGTMLSTGDEKLKNNTLPLSIEDKSHKNSSPESEKVHIVKEVNSVLSGAVA